MIIGLDFDNTIVSYDALFHRVALERGLIPAELPISKTAVRDHLRAVGKEDDWTAMQGEVYGARMAEAVLFLGASDFIVACREAGIELRIVSHKTRYPYRGNRYDLHAAARDWLTRQGFFDPLGYGLTEAEVFFEPTKAEKLFRIGECGCTHFIDDLPEILADSTFPARVRRYQFDPLASNDAATIFDGVGDWARLGERLLPIPSWHKSVQSLVNGDPEMKFVPLTGGANNHVFSYGKSFIVKRYFVHPNDPRDRLATERIFYAYIAACDVQQTPRSLGWDALARIGIFSLESGAPPQQVKSCHVDAAMEFIRVLNSGRHSPEAIALPAASEACFSIGAHLMTVARRVEALGSLPSEGQLDESARTFVRDVLEPAQREVIQQINNKYDSGAQAIELSLSERCISPSDFGFHNSLIQDDDKVLFLDFEYAGWDDPAKLVCDFFCQPDRPVNGTFFSPFVLGLAAALSLPRITDFEKRCRSLLPLYQIKWSCILLNDFTVTGRLRRGFSLGEKASAARRGRQLIRARELIERLRLAA